jgi:hypothetical protein
MSDAMSPFGPALFSYSRAQAIDDRVLVAAGGGRLTMRRRRLMFLLALITTSNCARVPRPARRPGAACCERWRRLRFAGLAATSLARQSSALTEIEPTACYDSITDA